MNAKEYLRIYRKTIHHRYFDDVYRIIEDLYPLRTDKEATVNYYKLVLMSDMRFKEFEDEHKEWLNYFREFGGGGLEEPIYELNTGEIDKDDVLIVRETLLNVIREDESFGYLFYLLSKKQDDFPEQLKIERAIHKETIEELKNSEKRIIELERQLKQAQEMPENANYEKQNQYTSNIQLSDKRGTQIDFIRVIDCLYELDFFKGVDGRDTTKKEVFDTLGKAINKDLSTFNQQLTSTKNSSNNDKLALKRIFQTMLDKQK